ncbi:TIGR01440 family protein [Actinomycetes bacterium NPDC127524]
MENHALGNREVWRNQFHDLLNEFQEAAKLNENDLLVIGCSTSEVTGNVIGTQGTLDVAEMLFSELESFHQCTGALLAFQCCEHLNRALVLSKKTAQKYGYEEVSVIPVRHAGGAMAAYAHQHLADAVVVEHIKADAGIDIGDTFIGMHIKHVAVPIRASLKEIGHAHVTMAKSRPKLIGGQRAVYEQSADNNSCT